MKGKNTENKQSINDLWGNSKQSNVLMIVVQEVEKNRGKGKSFDTVMTKTTVMTQI